MIRRLKLLFASAVLLSSTSVAHGQGCQPTESFSLNDDASMISIIPSSSLPAGTPYVVFTMTPQGGHTDHKVAVTSYTNVTFNWNAYNAPSGSTLTHSFYRENGGSSQPLGWVTGLSGSATAYTNPNWGWTVGSTWDDYAVLTNSGGNIIATDHVEITIVNGASGTIAYEDGQGTSRYLYASSTISGNSTMNPEYCPGANNAHHQADMVITLTNQGSGEVFSSPDNFSSMVPAVGNQYLTSNAQAWVAWLPGDTVTVNRTGRIHCTIAGFFLVLSELKDIQFENANNQFLGVNAPRPPGGQNLTLNCLEPPYAAKPDWDAAAGGLPTWTSLSAGPNGNLHDFAAEATLYRTGPFGGPFNGIQWHFLAQWGGEVYSPASGSVGCKNFDAHQPGPLGIY